MSQCKRRAQQGATGVGHLERWRKTRRKTGGASIRVRSRCRRGLVPAATDDTRRGVRCCRGAELHVDNRERGDESEADEARSDETSRAAGQRQEAGIMYQSSQAIGSSCSPPRRAVLVRPPGLVPGLSRSVSPPCLFPLDQRPATSRDVARRAHRHHPSHRISRSRHGHHDALISWSGANRVC